MPQSGCLFVFSSESVCCSSLHDVCVCVCGRFLVPLLWIVLYVKVNDTERKQEEQWLKM